jgi:hypothetical protein
MPTSKKGFRYLLVAIDYFTNWVEATVLKTLTADELVSAFFKIIISRQINNINEKKANKLRVK